MKLTRQRITLLGIFALFFGPLVLVILMRTSWWDYRPAKLQNNGRLVQPPFEVQLNGSDAIDGKWLLLYRLPERCEARCMKTVTALRQIHKAAGRQRHRLAIVLLCADAPGESLRTRLHAIYSRLQFSVDESGATLAKLARIEPAGGTVGGADVRYGIFILDPAHRVILAYNAEQNPSAINADLKRLLKWSKRDNTP
ncbi:MAG: hypothetical protein PVF89_05315 [Lysobacterales bacterium]|jgi:hypothetical protein